MVREQQNNSYPEKFQAIILDKQKHDYSNENIKFDNKTVETVSSARLLGVQLSIFSNIFKSAANQLSALIRLNNFYVSKEKEF